MAEADPEPESPAAAGEAAVLRSVRGIATFVAPTSLITALLVYFGWVWTDALSRYLGLDESLFPFSTRDYVLRSLTPAFGPLITLLLATLVAQWAHGALLRRIDRGLSTAFIPWLAAAAAVLLVVSLLTAVFGDDAGRNLFTPMGLFTGIALLAYAASLAAARRRKATKGRALPPSGSGLRLVVVLLLLAVALFWEVSVYAAYTGRHAGELLIDELDCRPDAIVYSDQRLRVGVAEQVLGDAGAPDAFRYTGLKLLLRSGGRYFLLPVDWAANPRTIVLPDSSAQRLEFVRTC
ncbi:MAG: hypothetical protein AVDCRST_MAG10-716 [uncultured Acidimicrobiales bacterium]|uniref:Uncharacterized protein n=1 Tax=uncultured Acidimicrobiales bacterium TaxID=310071 RepID=A0A6J4HE15_9ACTN|nr:MAG: hypothetical protein AVDCRST_MAG10-716 [uncultured Acidimicrobiales bacterium]